MPLIADYALDGLLAKVQEGTRLDICSSEPATYAAATGAASVGNKTGVSVGVPGDRTPNGRKVTVPAVTGGSVTGTNTATHWALTDPANSRLIATGTLAASQAVTTGNTFSLAAFDIGVPDAV
jgi:hypothetical protein